MARILDLDCRLRAVGHNLVRIGTGRLAASHDHRLRVKFDTESGLCCIAPVHPQTWRCGCAFVSAEHGFEEVGLHRLHANSGPLRGKVLGRAGGCSGRKRGMAGSTPGAGGAIDAVTGRIEYRSGARGGGTIRYAVPVLVVISAAVRRSAVAATRVSGGNHSIYLERTRPENRSVGGESEDKGLWRSVDDDGGTAVFELNPVVLLIGRKEGAVHEHAAVNEVEAPVSGAFEDTRHVQPGRRLFAKGRKDLGDHLAKGAQK